MHDFSKSQRLVTGNKATVKDWWRDALFYQIYPKSFMDSNGDGIGDLGGILSRLDYLTSLGVDAVWLNPIYTSPQNDHGYDISDYYSIDPIFGSMEDFQKLVTALHGRGMRLIMDLVINHVSSEHAWFQDVLSNPDSQFRDYFILRQGRNGNPPNNWRSIFGGSAWEPIAGTDEYYLHLFDVGQPDLNWENYRLRQEIHQMMRFWLDKGIDGYRMDAITLISKDQNFLDLPAGCGPADFDAPYVNGPRIFEFFQEMHTEVFNHYKACIFGESPGVNLDNVLEFIGGEHPLMHMVISSEIIDLDRQGPNRFVSTKPTLAEYRNLIFSWQSHLGQEGWNCNFLMNHDQPRGLSRFGHPGKYRERSGKTLMMLLFTLRGTPIVYQGEEIGMTNLDFTTVEDFNDVESINKWHADCSAGRGHGEIMEELSAYSRDNSRSPMQWNGTNNAGFSSEVPWLKVNSNYRQINVEAQWADEESPLAFFRRLVQLRKCLDVLRRGKFEPYASAASPDDRQILSFRRLTKGEQLEIYINLSDQPATLAIDGNQGVLGGMNLLISSVENIGKGGINQPLAPWEGRIYQFQPPLEGGSKEGFR